MTAINVPPTIADHPAMGQINLPGLGGAQKHAGFRFAAVTIGFALAGMITNLHAIDGKFGDHMGMDGLHDFLGERAAADIRLIGGDHEEIASGFQFLARGQNFGQNIKFRQAGGRIGFVGMFEGAVDDPVSVEKNCPSLHFVLSHLVWVTFSFGCDTSKCQTTA